MHFFPHNSYLNKFKSCVNFISQTITKLFDETLRFWFANLSLSFFLVPKGTQHYQCLSAKCNVSFLIEKSDLNYK